MAKPNKDAAPAGGLAFAAGLMRGIKNEQAAIAERQTAPASSPELASTSFAPPRSAESIASTSRLAIRVADCVSNPYNPREFYPEQKIHELALTLKREGQIEAIKVTRLPSHPEKYVVIDGERRLRAKRYLGDEYIDAELRLDQTAQELYSIAYRANNDHERQTLFDDAIAWRRVLDAGVFADQNALAQSVGKDKASISKTLSLNVLPRAMLERMAEANERVGLQAAYFIKLIFDKAGEELADRTLSSVIAGKKTVRDLERTVRSLSEEGAASKKTRARYDFRHEFVSGAESFGQLKAFSDGRVPVDLKGVPVEQQESLAEKLKAVIDAFVLETVNARASS